MSVDLLKSFESELEGLLNKYGFDNLIGVPDFTLAQYISNYLRDLASLARYIKP